MVKNVTPQKARFSHLPVTNIWAFDLLNEKKEYLPNLSSVLV